MHGLASTKAPVGERCRDIRVSVVIPTYNHEKYIAHAIESVLLQQVNFDFELIIGEDASRDGTRAIVLDYQARYPDKIRVLLQEEAAAERERALGLGGKTNFVEALQACSGQYIALLDGDDYWTSPHKLQRQVEFLTDHPDFAISFHNVERFYEDGSRPSEHQCPPNQKAVSGVEDLLKVNYVHFGSCMFPRGLFGEFPDWFFAATFGDWPLHVLNAQHGKIGYIDEVMAAYRIHDKGEWSSKSDKQRTLQLVDFYERINKHLAFKYHGIIGDKLFRCWYWLAVLASGEDDHLSARAWSQKCFAARPFYKHLSYRIKLLLRVYFPTIFRIARKIFSRSQRPLSEASSHGYQ